ncbi:hypothetical protein RB195_018584 [Necator americanus]|uniref:Uncharacterized protein n=1 Tax=Necator americanus TaxID=51031 RepID=A0ABR1CAF4_NECAM
MEYQENEQLFEVVTGVIQRAAAEPFLFSFAIDDIVGRIVESNSPADIILEPLRRLLTDLENADDVVIFAGSITKLQHVVNLVSKLAAAYVYALINACRCASLRDLERGFGWKDN